MTPLQAITTATGSGARLLGWEKDIGTIAPGHYADIVAVRGDPTVDIKLLHQMLFVMKGGVVYKGAPIVQQ
jgi:imidazolonepropionase-like amidohydrolase